MGSSEALAVLAVALFWLLAIAAALTWHRRRVRRRQAADDAHERAA